MVRTGMRLSEQASLTRLEVPVSAGQGGYQKLYGVIQDVGRISGERVTLRAGTLYGALERLDEDGLIAVDREEVTDGRLRRYYRLTDDGSARLAREAARRQESAATALRRLGTAGPGLAGGTV